MGQFLSWLIRRRQADGGGVVDARGKAESRKLKFRQKGLKLVMKQHRDYQRVFGRKRLGKSRLKIK